MNTYIVFTSDGTITRCFRQTIEPVLEVGESLLIDNSITKITEVDWRAKKVEDGAVVDRTNYQPDVEQENIARRDTELLASDWSQLPDSPLTDEQKTEWRTYRQALRDLTTHSNWPNLNEVDWPLMPQ